MAKQKKMKRGTERRIGTVHAPFQPITDMVSADVGATDLNRRRAIATTGHD
jgi:hypothetical protein